MKKPRYKDITKARIRFSIISSTTIFLIAFLTIPSLRVYYSSREEMGAMIAIQETFNKAYPYIKNNEEIDESIDFMDGRIFIFELKNDDVIDIINTSNFKVYIEKNLNNFKKNPIFTSEGITTMMFTKDEAAYYSGFHNDKEAAINNEKIATYVSIAFLIAFLLSLAFFGVSFVITHPIKKYIDIQNDFVDNVSHELKTPLSIIQANAELLKLDKENSDEYISNICQETRDMNSLIKELLDLSELDGVVREPTFIDISSLTKQILLSYDALAYEKGVNFTYNVQDDLFTVISKKDFTTTLRNIISNAFKFVDKNNIVKIELKKEKKNIILSSYNTGCTLQESDAKKIFRKFYKDSSRPNSSGVGLAFVKSFCDKYNYKLSCTIKSNESFLIEIKMKQKDAPNKASSNSKK